MMLARPRRSPVLAARTIGEDMLDRSPAALVFTGVVQDIILGDDLPAFLDLVQSRPLLLVVLAPRPDVIETRERARSKSGYAGSGWSVADLDRSLRLETPRIGLWIDSSEQAPAQTADEILRRAWDEAVVEPLRRDA